MKLGDYELCDHTQVPDRVRQLTELSNLGFGNYEGAMRLRQQWMAWYLQRPGMDPKLCQAAMFGQQMVSNVLVTVQPLQIGGQLLTCGIIDTVVTHPEHRRRGLARALMEQAHEAMQEMPGVDAAVLYTNPDDHPYEFYQGLGYQTRAYAALLAGRRPEADEGPLDAHVPEDAGQPLFDLMNGFFCKHEGYCPMEADLWAWHKCQRPRSNPLTLVVQESNGRPTGTATFANADTLIEGQRCAVSVAYDVVVEQLTRDKLAGLLAAAPSKRVQMILDTDSPEYPLATEIGLEPKVREVPMILPLSERGKEAVANKSGPWYPMIESIIGV